MKGHLISLKHGFEMLDKAIAKGSPKRKIKPYHRLKILQNPEK